jgi:hypothetical protein
MKNYIGLYIIAALLFILMCYTYIFVGDVQRELLADVKELSTMEVLNENTDKLYRKIENNFLKMESKITSFVNHSVYKDIVKELDEIKYDIKFNIISDFKKDSASLLNVLEEIIENEKPKINNIF